MHHKTQRTAFLYRALAALLLVLPTVGGQAFVSSEPPPPRFEPINAGVHVVAIWPSSDRKSSRPVVADGAPTGGTTLLSKAASAASVAPDGMLTYSIAVTNATNITQTFRITDTLPVGLTYMTNTATGGFIYNAASTDLTATTRTLNAFHGDVVTTTGAPPYREIITDTLAANICQTYFSECDDNAITLALPLPFRYLGVDYTTITLDSNGFVIPGSINPGPAFQNQNLPDPAAPNNVIAPFWDDLDLHGNSAIDPGGGDWLYALRLVQGSEYLVVEWHNAQKKGDAGTAYSFQVWIQLHAEHITFAYKGLTGTTSSATIGFENSDGTLGHSYLYNGAGQVPGLGDELRLVADFDTTQLGFDVKAQRGLRGCSTITNTANLTDESGARNASASATTNTFGPCQFLTVISR